MERPKAEFRWNEQSTLREASRENLQHQIEVTTMGSFAGIGMLSEGILGQTVLP